MRSESESLRSKNLLNRYPLTSFFIMSYLFFLVALLAIGAIVNLTKVSNFAMGLLIAIAAWTPNVAAMVVDRVTNGKGSAKRLFSLWLRWGTNGWWYVFAFAPIAIAFVTAGLFALIDNGNAPGSTSGYAASAFFMMLFFHIIQGASGEELGWRGFALPRLQKKFSALISALITGALVSGWHGLLHLVSPTGVPEWQFILLITSYSVIITWAYNKSHGNVLVATLFHFAFNFSLEIVSTSLELMPLESLFAVRTAVYTAIALALVIGSRGKLGMKDAKRRYSRSTPKIVDG